MDSERESDIESSFYSETWPRLEPGSCPHISRFCCQRQRERKQEREIERKRESERGGGREREREKERERDRLGEGGRKDIWNIMKEGWFPDRESEGGKGGYTN